MLHLAANLEGQPVLVIGAGAVGAHKAGQLLDAGALVAVITAEVVAPLPLGLVSVEVRPYRTGDVAGHLLVVSATGDGATNDQIVAEAAVAKTWLNVVDDPGRSNFFFAATHRSGEVVVSVSTEGGSPALAQVLRNRIADSLPEDLAEIVAVLRVEREALHASGVSTEGFDWTSRITELLEGAGQPPPEMPARPRR